MRPVPFGPGGRATGDRDDRRTPAAMVTMPHLRERLTENWLLAALPESEQEQLAHCLKLVPLTSQDVLVHQNEPVPALWFPLSAVVSLTASTRDGHVLQPAL